MEETKIARRQLYKKIYLIKVGITLISPQKNMEMPIKKKEDYQTARPSQPAQD